ncbi:TRL-like family protein [Leptospira interrogans]|uniref:TRL-like family protein n=2 Tax=Leptospira interrogans serovar Pyrogenes TaxID=280500 RepID=M6ZV02_LEPIR|nr:MULTISPECIES: TRL-like family protein [Leptospira]EMP08112.1 TRL-like family protein [Leptospira interrogans serovar Pyrogenes str. 200701872]MCL8309257.1 TRL-like family protein [Leptospira interrogans]QCO36940.1 TRL-like family protein [Leptospira interrogans]ULG85789.1 TRL-like family protein [Leptospira interrogans]ULG87355.1 TRL-like family protein [Leptospira interrogans]
MKLKSLLFICFMTIWAVQCTGLNIMYSYGHLQPNTNPTKDYAVGLPLYFKGGIFVHDGVIPGPLGDNAENTSIGKACSKNILWLVSFGDSSIEAAKADGKITKVASIEYEQLGVFYGAIYHKFCTVVTGSNAAVETKTDAKSATGKKK